MSTSLRRPPTPRYPTRRTEPERTIRPSDQTIVGAIERRTTSDTRPLLVTTNEAAHMLGVARTTIYQLVGRGTLPTVHIGRSVRFKVQDLETFVDRLVNDAP